MGEKQKPVAAESQIQVRKQLSYSEIEQISKAFVASGMFGRDVDKISKGITKIMAGQELGLAPFASMRAVHVIEGNATLSANTMAGMVKSSGRYDYTVVKKESNGCVIDFYEIIRGKRTKIGTESFDAEEAKAAGLLNKQNWQKYPKAMMFARCISNGVRTYCPDVFSGMLVYTPDELDARVNASGDVIDMDADGNITNMPEQKSDSKKPEKEEAEVVEDPSNEGTEDHPDVTDPNEPAETSGPDDVSGDSAEVEEPAADPEPEEEPLPPVDDEFKEAAWGMYESLPIKAQHKLRWLKDVTGVITQKSIKTEQQWRDLMARAEAVIAGDEEIPADQRTDAGEQGKIV